jgi:geranylgeranyl diphosphate synthase type I
MATLLARFSNYYQETVHHALQEIPMLSRMLGYHHGWNDPDGNPLQVQTGKQIRPLLTLLSCGAMGAPIDQSLALASGIELIHNFSLIHDDIMDESDMRRGRNTVWRIWGNNQAINAGDGAYGLAFYVLSLANFPTLDPWMIVHGERLLAKACVDTVWGQMLDLSFETREDVQTDEYVQMVGLKTGPLLGVALGGGALFAGKSLEIVQALDQIGRHLGIAFQIQDDVLGVWGDSAQTGKSNMDDITHKKKALPILWGLQHLSPELVIELREIYHQPAPLSLDAATRVHDILTDAGIRQAIEGQAKQYYSQVIEGIQTLYPPSDYREGLLTVAELIVNRSN